MFDPTKLDIDFSDTTDVGKIEKEKVKQEQNKTPAKTQSEDVLSAIDGVATEPKVEKDTMVLENNSDLTETEKHEEKVEEELHLNLKDKGDTSLLATIITDAELVEKDKELKAYKEQKELEKQDPNNTSNIIIDINLQKLGDILKILVSEKYDYFRVEPTENEAKIIFVKDSVDKETKFVKYPTYSRLILEMKKAGGLKLDVTDNEQKGKAKYDFEDRQYNTIVKTKPSSVGEKVYFKIEETVKTAGKKKKEKISFAKIMWFLVALLLTTLIIGGLFLAFILFNSSTIGDLKFFNDLGVDVDKVRQFVAMLVNAIFFTIVFIMTGFAVTFIFKAILTKKEYKKKKTSSAIIAVFLLFLTFATGFIWLTLSKKVAELKGLNYGKPVIYDNSKILSNFYESDRDAIINANDQIVGPITLKFDVSAFLEKLRDDGNTPQKITWIFNGDSIEKPAESDEIIQEFNEVGLQTVELVVDTINLEGESEEITKDVAQLDIAYAVEVNEKSTASGGKTYSFDARSLKDLGNIEWYYIPDLSDLSEEEKAEKVAKALDTPVIKGSVFSPQEVLFEKEIIVGMYIDSKGKVKSSLDKIFVVGGEGESDIKGNINVTPMLENDLSYEFWLDELDNSFGNGFIDTVTWTIAGKDMVKEVDITDVRNSSSIKHTFKEYGENRVIATLQDTNGNTKIIEKTVGISKRLALKNTLDIYDREEKIGRYNNKTYEYSINGLATPTEITLDARFVSPTNQIYAIKKVEWDFDSDGNVDETGKLIDHKIETVGNHHIIVTYTFEHRTVKGNSIEMVEHIYIDSIKKDSILDLKIEKESNYVPLIVRFDASRSEVQGDDIEKFIYDYGDGTPPEERDAINPGHKYLEAGNYKVKLTVKTLKGKEYTIVKELNLLNRPQEIVLSASLKKTKMFQEINFSSEKSNGQINSYYWDFGDGDYSTVANPVKSFDKAGTYTVKLTGTFANNNVETDEIEIVIEE